MSGIWNEKTLKIAQIVVSVLLVIASLCTTLVTALAAQGIDIAVVGTIAAIVDALAGALALFFGVKKQIIINQQSAEIAQLEKDKAALAAHLKFDDTENSEHPNI